MSYLLKHFDTELITFNLFIDPLEGLVVEWLESDDRHRSLFPIDLEPTAKGLLRWLNKRTIPRNRAFVQSFLAKLGLNVNDTKGIIDIGKGLSLNDCYWIVEDTFSGSFEQYNLYDNRFNRVLSLIAYTGYGETQKSGFVSTPELTTDGMLAKCWRRIDGKIRLFKAGSSGAANTGNEPYSEFYAVQIARKMGLNAVPYNLNQWKGQLFSTCELFTSKAVSYVPIGRIVQEGGWAAVLHYYRNLGDAYYDAVVDMLVFDALICNEDRHFGNFGLLLDSQTNTIIDTAPIFDNGLSLFNYAMDEDLRMVDAYASTRRMATGQAFMAFISTVIRKKQQEKARKLINFTFTKHPRYNLSPFRLKAIEAFLQTRVRELLAVNL